jgi:hypothetical protein
MNRPKTIVHCPIFNIKELLTGKIDAESGLFWTLITPIHAKHDNRTTPPGNK